MEVSPPTQPNESSFNPNELEPGTFRISPEPVIEQGGEPAAASAGAHLPSTYGTQTLCLLARDPHSIFAYWDIDWHKAFANGAPQKRKVHLRLLDENGTEQALIEVEPMAGGCELSVPDADVAYAGEIGYFHPPEAWNSLASSELVRTPPETLADDAEVDFATVPFHLAFQHMVDLLRVSKQEKESLMTLLGELRQQAKAPEADSRLTPQQRELAQVLESAATPAPAVGPAAGVTWSRQRLERVLGFGATSPSEGFGGSSRTA